MVPVLFMVLEIVFNKIKFCSDDLPYCFLMVILFGLMDSIITYSGYEPAYPPILIWTNWVSVIIVFGFSLILALGFVVGWLITRKRK